MVSAPTAGSPTVTLPPGVQLNPAFALPEAARIKTPHKTSRPHPEVRSSIRKQAVKAGAETVIQSSPLSGLRTIRLGCICLQPGLDRGFVFFSKLVPMPELPEVETTRRGLAPHLEGRRIVAVTLRRPDLRWPIPREIEALLPSRTITAIRRRAKHRLRFTARLHPSPSAGKEER